MDDALIETLKEVTGILDSLCAPYAITGSVASSVHGGKVVARGDLAKIAATKRSITGKYLRGDEKIEVPKIRRAVRQVSRGKQ